MPVNSGAQRVRRVEAVQRRRIIDGHVHGVRGRKCSGDRKRQRGAERAHETSLCGVGRAWIPLLTRGVLSLPDILRNPDRILRNPTVREGITSVTGRYALCCGVVASSCSKLTGGL